MFTFNRVYSELEMMFKDEELNVYETLVNFGKLMVNSFAIQNELMCPIGRAVYFGYKLTTEFRVN